MDLNFKTEGQILTCTNAQEIVTDSTKYIYANFTFSSDWDGRGKTAEFKNSNIDQGRVQVITNNRCEVPHEVMTANGKLTVCVKGIMGSGENQSIIHTKMRTPLRLRLSDKVDCVNSVNPTPTEIEQLENAVGQIQTNFGGHLTRTDNPHSVTKTQVGLSTVTNDKQVKGVPSGTTNGNLVKFGADGYTVADSGESVTTLKKDITANMLKPTLQTTVSNGITCTSNGDGTYTIQPGTASARTLFYLFASTNIDNKYRGMRFVGCPSGGSGTTYYMVIDYQIDTVYKVKDMDVGNGFVISMDTSYNKIVPYIVIGAGTVITTPLVFKPMITANLSATYDSFVAYTGTNKRLNEVVSSHETSISSIKDDIADKYSASSIYAVGNLVMYGDTLYKCTTAITVAEAWTVAHWTPTTLDNEIIANKTAIATTNTNLSTTNTNLNTTNTNMAQLLVVEKKSTTADVTVPANTYANVTIPISKTGYTPIGVVGAASQINCPFFGFSISPDKLNVLLYARNVTASNVTTQMNADILYMKNLS